MDHLPNQERQNFTETVFEKFIPINEILSYGITVDNLHIHLSDLQMSLSEKQALV